MHIRVEIRTAGERPPAGSPVLVQVRDTALQDVESTVMAETRGRSAADEVLAVAELDVAEGGAYPTVFVHVDVDGDGEISEGDYITMQSYPCRGGAMTVEVRKV